MKDAIHSQQNSPSLNRHGDPIRYLGHSIYHHVYTGLTDEQMVPAIEATVDAMVAAGKSDLLILLDARGVKFDRQALGTFKRHSHRSKDLIHKMAVVGIHQIQTAFLNYIATVFKLNIRGFDDIEVAQAWLVE